MNRRFRSFWIIMEIGLSFIVVKAAALECVSCLGDNKITASSLRARISSDGRVVVFESFASLVPDDVDLKRDVYLFDRSTQVLERILGEDPSRTNGGASISPEGRVVAFHSKRGSSITESTTPVRSDIVCYDRVSKKAHTLLQNVNGRLQDGDALYPELGAYGQLVLFTSNASNLAVDLPFPYRAIYLYDRSKLQVDMVSRRAEGPPANRPSGNPKMSGNGRFIAFLSAATNLVSILPVESLANHLYLIDRWRSEVIRVDENERGFDANEWLAGDFDLDETGNILIFEGRRRITGQPSKSLSSIDLFLFDRSSGTVTLFTTGIFASRSHSPAVSGDGRYVAFIFDGIAKQHPGGLVIYDRKRDVWKRIVMGTCTRPDFSADGRTIVFESADPQVWEDNKLGTRHIFVVENPFKEDL